jgi:hypothetical protein
VKILYLSVALAFVAAIFTSGMAYGALFIKPDVHHSEVYIAKPVITATQTQQPTAIETMQIAQVQIIQDTPQPAKMIIVNPTQETIAAAPAVQEVLAITSTQEIPTAVSTQEVLIIDSTPTPNDYSEWIHPLDLSGPIPNEFPTIQYTDYSAMTLDQAWDTAEAVGIDDHFPQCSYPLPTPYIDWQMALELSQQQTADRSYTEIKMQASDISAIAARGGAYFPAVGIVQISEDAIPSMLLQLYGSGSLSACRDANNRPNGYGPGVQAFLDNLASSYLISQ